MECTTFNLMLLHKESILDWIFAGLKFQLLMMKPAGNSENPTFRVIMECIIVLDGIKTS